MGGARCSYRNCTTKSDKKTHMFHFPVFDKVRCHQWITNAQKLNFLDLKLSQLKNRLICEHHFTDDCFMNVLKAKLKNTAVPTKNGPFCVNLATENLTENSDGELPIHLEDIVDDYLINSEKKAHFSVKYGDFLTNDVTEPITLIPSNKSNSVKLEDKSMAFDRYVGAKYNIGSPLNNVTSYKNILGNNDIDTKVTNITGNDKNADTSSSLVDKQILPNPRLLAIQFEELNPKRSKPSETSNAIAQTEFDTVLPSHKVKSSSSIPPSKKVKIISERKISAPVRVAKGELQHISPSIVLNVPNMKNKRNVEMNGSEINTYYVDLTNSQQIGNMQGYDNFGIITSQCNTVPTETDQMCLLTDYNQPPMLVDQIERFNTLEVQNAELHLEDTKQKNYVTSEDDTNKELEHETGLLTHTEPVMVSNVEFVSTSLSGPSVFTITGVPQVSTHLSDSTFLPQVSQVPTGIQNAHFVSDDLETLDISVNAENVSSVSKNTQNVFDRSKNVQNNLNKRPTRSSSNISFLKNRMPPEKLAYIEEKRKFNMKLSDIINSCLNKLDDESDASKLTADMKREMNDKKIREHLSSDSGLPTSQENNIAYLEARLQRMENALLNKIEQNSHRITELKRTLIRQTSSKKSTHTQTYLNTEINKRYLYQQISQFLSPDANSLIYEELFINKCVSKTENPLIKRKRK